jgi:hypothetical protein
VRKLLLTKAFVKDLTLFIITKLQGYKTKADINAHIYMLFIITKRCRELLLTCCQYYNGTKQQIDEST